LKKFFFNFFFHSLQVDPLKRKTSQQLLKHHFITKYKKESQFEYELWVQNINNLTEKFSNPKIIEENPTTSIQFQ